MISMLLSIQNPPFTLNNWCDLHTICLFAKLLLLAFTSQLHGQKFAPKRSEGRQRGHDLTDYVPDRWFIMCNIICCSLLGITALDVTRSDRSTHQPSTGCHKVRQIDTSTSTVTLWFSQFSEQPGLCRPSGLTLPLLVLALACTPNHHTFSQGLPLDPRL